MDPSSHTGDGLLPPPVSTTDDQVTAQVNQALEERRNRRPSWAPFPGKGRATPIPSSSRDSRKSLDDDYTSPSGFVSPTLVPTPAAKTPGPEPAADLIETSSAKQELQKEALFRYMQVYENQRGRTWLGFKFSNKALKSGLHLKDPTSYTTVFEGKEVELPYKRLNEVQLPSAEWAWHGRDWLIDMRGDGATSYDGFEYSRGFRKTQWKAIAPKHYFLTCVRRRRWLRLMVHLPSLSDAHPASRNYLEQQILAGSEEPSAAPSSTAIDRAGDEEWMKVIWKGEDDDWVRCHAALKGLLRDGKKLEAWRNWIGLPSKQDFDRRKHLWTEDQNNTPRTLTGTSRMYELLQEQPMFIDTHRAPQVALVSILNVHMRDILGLFIYPDSRTQFTAMLRDSGLYELLNEEAQTLVDFAGHDAWRGGPKDDDP